MILELQKELNSLEADSIHFEVVQKISEMLNLLNKSIVIKYYKVKGKHCSIEFLIDKEKFIDIEIASNNIEFRGDGFETMIFYDSNCFNNKYSELISAFFSGDYKIIDFLDRKNKKVAFGLSWSNKKLNCFNIEKEYIGFFKKTISNREFKNGYCLIDPH